MSAGTLRLGRLARKRVEAQVFSFSRKLYKEEPDAWFRPRLQRACPTLPLRSRELRYWTWCPGAHHLQMYWTVEIIVESLLILTIRLSSQAKGQQFTQEVIRPYKCLANRTLQFVTCVILCLDFPPRLSLPPKHLYPAGNLSHLRLEKSSGAPEARRPWIWSASRRHQDCCQGQECPPGVQPFCIWLV